MNTLMISGAALVLAATGATLALRRQCFDVPEGFYGLLYRHGKSLHRISPGRHWFWQRGHTVRLVDMRKMTLTVTSHLLSGDDAPLKVSAVLTYQIIQAETALHEVADYAQFLDSAVRLALRSLVCATEAGAVLGRRSEIGAQLLAQVQPEADSIGILAHALEVTDVAAAGALTKMRLEPQSAH